jgi:hypothetical protein
MKRLLLPLLAALTLPTAVNAEVANYYLLGIAERKTYVVPMESLELCEEAGIKAVNPKEWYKSKVGTAFLSYVCLKAK